MSLTWKDGVATIGAVIATIITVALLTGSGELIYARWAYGSVLLFAILAFTAMLTGTASLMDRNWTRIVMYILVGAAVVITGVNIFLNSGVLFAVLAVVLGVLWLEFVSVHLFGVSASTRHTPPDRGGVAL